MNDNVLGVFVTQGVLADEGTGERGYDLVLYERQLRKSAIVVDGVPVKV